MSGRLTLRTAVPLLMFLAAQNSYGQEGLTWHDLKPGLSEESVLSGLRRNYQVTELGTEGQPPDDFRSWLVMDRERVVGEIHFLRGKLLSASERLASVSGNKEAMDFVRKLYQALWLYARPRNDKVGSVLGSRSCIATLELRDFSRVGDSLEIYIDPVGAKSRLRISFHRLGKLGELIELESILWGQLELTDKSPSKQK